MASDSNLAKELLDARKLADVAPVQAKKIAQSYISTLSPKMENGDYSSSVVKGKLTPIVKAANQVHAYQTIAISDYMLGNFRASLSSIDRSISISKTNRLQARDVESRIIKTRLLWLMTKDERKVKAPLAEITNALKTYNIEDNQRELLELHLNLLKAKILSGQGKNAQADELFAAAQKKADKLDYPKESIQLSLDIGEYHLKSERLNLALSELIQSYWFAIEQDNAQLIARANNLLADLYIARQMYSKAQEHLSQAASYYGQYEHSPIFAKVLRKLADVYFIQGRYNLALVHYFNVLDLELAEKDLEEIIDLRLSLSETYLNLVNYTLSERYLNRATELLDYSDVSSQKVRATLIKAKLDSLQNKPKQAEKLAIEALAQAKKQGNSQIQLKALDLLHGVAKSLNKNEDSLGYLEEFNRLTAIDIQKKNQLINRAFLNQVSSVEQSLHYQDQVDELTDLSSEFDTYKSISFGLSITTALLLLILFIYIKGVRNRTRVINELNQELYTHPRSGLRNMRLLIRNLPDSLERTGRNYEQWRFGQLIDEPLNDRLKFALIDVPMLEEVYLKYGYKEGRIAELEFGQHIQSQLPDGARLYHFSDHSFLYIEPNPDKRQQSEVLFERFQSWIEEFNHDYDINRTFVVSFADYPFLPRAYTAINDEDLIDLLLLSVEIATKISKLEQTSQWVSFTAIPMAPAASFAQDNIRSSTLSAIKKGLIKVQTSGVEKNLTSALDALPKANN
ncbi:tetratricopeptide repeat protein [Vibrio gallicus]|uniref:tetratricopeptide repeat protein n=1 Tax=Vibrio gallicus TaxID=190897 RepID=UPI0021C27B7C|nr:tetratricopeptide repeat protein [Vibrio gallicus]